ncbi:hypothetical protein Dimus_025690 [Dionaea muscipula]
MTLRSRSKCLYKFLKGLIRDGKYSQIEPVLAAHVKKRGLIGGRLGKILVHYLCLKKDVGCALRVISKLSVRNLHFRFPVDVLGVLVKLGRASDAYQLVMGARYSLPSMDVVDYSVVIDGLCKEGHLERALNLCGFARTKGIELNVVVYNIILNGLCRQGCLVEAFRLFDSLERVGVFPSCVTYGILIDALVREGFLLDARQLFERMDLKGLNLGTHIYNTMIYGYCKFGNVQEGLKLLHEMEDKCHKPDEFTVSAVIDGFCREGDLEEALHLFVYMKRKGVCPDFLGFLHLVRGLCAKGRMEEARGILRQMIQTDSVVELINRVDAEMDADSVESFLAHLCEDGRIDEAVTILNEIARIFFPCKRNAANGVKRLGISSQDAENGSALKPQSFVQGMSLALGSSNMKKEDMGLESCYDSRQVQQESELAEFDAFYSQLASLCSVGKVQEASELAKQKLNPDLLIGAAGRRAHHGTWKGNSRTLPVSHCYSISCESQEEQTPEDGQKPALETGTLKSHVVRDYVFAVHTCGIMRTSDVVSDVFKENLESAVGSDSESRQVWD